MVLDNIKFHHSEEVKTLLIAAGIEVMYLPAYSCGFNSIEALWSTVKLQWKRFLITKSDVTLKIDDAVTAIKTIMDNVPI